MKNINYKEYPLKTAVLLYPFIVPFLRSTGVDIDDPDYVCRIDGNGTFEFGYRSDSVWTLC